MTAMSAKIAQLEGRLQAAESDLGLLRQTVHDLLLENRQLALGVDPRRLGALADDVEPGPAAATAGRSRADPPRDLLSFLELLRLGHFCERIHNLGAESVADLVDVEDPDLVALGFSQLERNRFFRAVRAQGLLSERAAIRHGDALEMLLQVTESDGLLEAAFEATGWDQREEWLAGTRAMLGQWERSGGRREAAVNQELLAVVATAAEQQGSVERLLHCLRIALPSRAVQLAGVAAIRRLAASDDRGPGHLAMELSSGGASTAVLRAFRYHAQDRDLAVEGLAALAALASHGGPLVGQECGAAGGIAAALDWMAAHEDDADVFAAGCGVLSSVPLSEFWARTAEAEAAAKQQRRRLKLATSTTPRGAQEPEPEPEQDGGTVGVVIAGISRHWEHPQAQAAACALVEQLVEHSEEGRTLVTALDGARVVIGALTGRRTQAAAGSKPTLTERGAGMGDVVKAAHAREAAALLQARGCGVLANLARGNAELACEIRQSGAEAAARAAMETYAEDTRVVETAQRLLKLLDVQSIIGASRKRGDVRGVVLAMKAGLGSSGAQQTGCEALAEMAHQVAQGRNPHGIKHGAAGPSQPVQPRLSGTVDAVFSAMVTHPRVGPVQAAGCWALAALASAIPAEGRPDAAGRGGPATLLSVGDEWEGQLAGMAERARAAQRQCPKVPIVEANSQALLKLLEGEPASSVILAHPSKGWGFIPRDATKPPQVKEAAVPASSPDWRRRG